jgi:glutamate/tyrosine decarboxylase-like PLP-dependent enzyme
MDHPRYFAFIPGPSNFVGAMGDAIASGFNVLAANWLEASAAGQVELVTIDWLNQLCGFPPSGGGLFLSGGSMANLTGLMLAREHKLGTDPRDGVVYFSDQTHYSVEKGLKVLGFTRGQMRRMPSDDAFRLDLPRLADAIQRDREDGLRPICVVANAGTTSTGAVDPLPELAALCEQQELWLHVDGAYGAAAVITDRGRSQLEGLARAHSICLDPHKWLFQPYEMGCLLVREDRWLVDIFTHLPEYLQEVEAGEEEVHYFMRGIQLSRGFRALKLWLSLQVFGLDGFRAAVERGFRLAQLAGEMIAARPDWEIVTPAQMGILTFRYAPGGREDHELDDLNSQLIDLMIEDGFAMLSSTQLRGRKVLRICPINPRCTRQDLEGTLDRLERMATQLG